MGTASRRAVLGAALAIPATVALAEHDPSPSRGEWDRRKAHYERLDLLQRADLKFGPFDQANEQHYMINSLLAGEYGSRAAALADPAGRDRADAAQAALHHAEKIRIDTLAGPWWQAARELALTPAPNVEAIRYKIALIEEHDLSRDSEMPRDPFVVVREDIERLYAMGWT